MTYFNKNKELKRGYNAYIDESTNYMGTLMNVGLLVMEDGDFLFRLVEGEGVTGLHQQEAHVHLGAHIVHGGVDIGVISVLQLVILIKISHRVSSPNL